MNAWLLRKWLEFLNPEEGQDLVEYALLMILIALFAVIALKAVGTAIVGVYSNAAAALSQQPGP